MTINNTSPMIHDELRYMKTDENQSLLQKDDCLTLRPRSHEDSHGHDTI